MNWDRLAETIYLGAFAAWPIPGARPVPFSDLSEEDRTKYGCIAKSLVSELNSQAEKAVAVPGVSNG